MSDLVERVAGIIAGMNWDVNASHRNDARLVIKAVAEWGQNNFYSDKPLGEFLSELLAQLEDKR